MSDETDTPYEATMRLVGAMMGVPPADRSEILARMEYAREIVKVCQQPLAAENARLRGLLDDIRQAADRHSLGGLGHGPYQNGHCLLCLIAYNAESALTGKTPIAATPPSRNPDT